MEHEETTSRDVIVNIAFSATIFLFIFNGYAIVSRFLYLYSTSWLPFLVIIGIPLYPALRRCMATTTILLLAFTCLAACAIVKFILPYFHGMDSIFTIIDALSLVNFAISIVVFCAFFDRRSELSSMASATTIGKENAYLVIGSSIVAASCFALGGSGVDSDALSAILLVPIAIAILIAWWRKKWQNGTRLETLLHDDKGLQFLERFKAGYSLISTVNDAMLLAVVIFFAGTMLIPYFDPFHGAAWDATTWRFIAAIILTLLAILSFFQGNRVKDIGEQGTNASPSHHPSRKSRIILIASIWASIIIFSGLVFFIFATVQEYKSSIEEIMTPAIMTIAIMLLVQGVQLARMKSSIHASSNVSKLQCLRAGVIAGVFLGIGAPALMLFVRVGMNVDAALYMIIAIASTMLLELHLLVRQARRK